ncbi:hypothetical protein IWW34DRAFT_722153 [Fusarium oxysporum f. sp. albedinis]|uniref:Transmembrane protein n=5 Tax=Fusarium oxysporum TaxID=5507 RepID=X0AAJ3_FUSOX|nr:uncharacterized protein FOBCDRAFT_224660 [Fusarium oxysporum Fo47]EWZ81324.1 hypothetical protein FOWG_14877 [Fusarium oxysporum f. sp. lycopersici MN25]EXA46177.1 hypothetical protein FOVG_06925 [Fusarium oxysporum f. sp. pisi HDV247]EXK40690.1 hypothetical protein FOMG_07452 [Fusarium oxysporum f. sp. melonis 26406]KAH7480849.1 hypothetical protein FOMA001_g7668 [Fusarium oxysporum f. sp. matthiolae]KAI3584342.1 hypothetical protein IWW34DRAFT_722153 [Fusarium oxysporum f. sp. albedinis]
MDHETSHLPTWQDNKTTSEKAGFAGDDESSALLNDKTKNQQTMQLRQIFANRLMPVAFALPWVMGMLISWIPFTKISLYNAPDFLILAALISTLEVLSIVAVFIFTSLRPSTLETEPSPSTTLKEKFFRAWFWFLFISPFITGTMVVLMASDISCDPEDDLDMHQPICQVGIRLIKATALCRAGIIATFLFATSSYLEQRPTKRCTDSDSA